MVFTNLKGLKKIGAKPFLPGYLGIAGIFFSAVIYWMIPTTVSEFRPLNVEEVETVILTLGGIDAASIPQVIQLEDFTEAFAMSSVPSFVDSGVDPEKLVEGTSDLLRFSPEFFNADSSVQRQSLTRLLEVGSDADAKEIATIDTAE